jgi:hypothetical protein
MALVLMPNPFPQGPASYYFNQWDDADMANDGTTE